MAVSADDVRKLAQLSRLALTAEEVEKLRGELDAIVSYIDAVQQVSVPEAAIGAPHTDLTNVLRTDSVGHETGAYTEDLIAQFPDSEDEYLRVKKIIG